MKSKLPTSRYSSTTFYDNAIQNVHSVQLNKTSIHVVITVYRKPFLADYGNKNDRNRATLEE